MQVIPPDPNSRRARFADWLELRALTNANGEESLSALRSLLRRGTDDRASPNDYASDADDNGEQEVTDRAADDLNERVSEEIGLRIRTVGPAYPFELVEGGAFGTAQVLRRKESWQQTQSGELVYTFCLLDSALRDHLIDVPRSQQSIVTRIGYIFQICSCIAVGGYTGADVVSFGFPRATGDAFLPALRAAWRRYGSYTVRPDVPHGFDDKLKDGGVDIIAWRNFNDGHAATFLMFVQVASGLDWKDKPVADDVKAIKQWFVDERFEHFLPAICIPFPLWFDLDEPPKSAVGDSLPYAAGILRRFAVREAKFGVIFDRGRIALSSSAVLGSHPGSRANIDGVDRIGEVDEWVGEVMGEIAERRSAA